jgi:hypothetical protein
LVVKPRQEGRRKTAFFHSEGLISQRNSGRRSASVTSVIQRAIARPASLHAQLQVAPRAKHWL